MASEGIQELDSSKFDCKNNNGESGFGSDINVPVYATVKGVSHFLAFLGTIQTWAAELLTLDIP